WLSAPRGRRSPKLRNTSGPATPGQETLRIREERSGSGTTHQRSLTVPANHGEVMGDTGSRNTTGLMTFIYGNGNLPFMTGEDSNPPVFSLGFDVHYPSQLNSEFRPEMAKGRRNLKDSYFNPDTKEDLRRVIDRSFRPATEILLDLLDEG